VCGIVGLASRAPVERGPWLSVARDLLRHRGPDDVGEWWSTDRRVGFAHTRLAIVDLSPAGRQPMQDTNGELCIVFNGEIYNFLELRKELREKGHAFRSHTDTEVILAAYREWGTECLSHLNGMFAFGLYDTRFSRVFLARDRAGEKPLFYSIVNGVLRFASELKALMANETMPRRLSPLAFDYYLAFGYVPGELCILADVKKLPPASAFVFDLATGEEKVWEYWRLPDLKDRDENTDAGDRTLLDEFEFLLEDAVRRQLVADVPVGILLSGGIDSSLVAAMAVRATPTIKTFTVSFPGHGSFDEGPYARMVASHLGTSHTELVAEAATVQLLPELARQYDEPIGDSSMVPTYLVSRLVRENCTVALGGDGGDELFGGYVYHSRMQAHMRWRRLLPSPLKMLVGSSASFLPTGARGRSSIRSLAMADGDAWVAPPLHFDFAMRRRLAPSTRELFEAFPEQYRLRAGSSGHTALQKMTIADFKTYLPEDILVKVDRASMLTSLEIRAPFLDYRLVQFAFGKVPDRLRATRSERKILLKRLARKVLPPQMDLHRKQGFSLPLQSWFKGEWGSYLDEVLRAAPQAIYDASTVNVLLREQERGLANAQRLFNLAIFELWRREYQVTLG
jgi:asparagine synthase (glutamine-hydrolysing)